MQAATFPEGGCSLGPRTQHQPVFQRYRWALAFLTAQSDPDIRAAAKWDGAWQESYYKKTPTKQKKSNQPKKPNQQAF